MAGEAAVLLIGADAEMEDAVRAALRESGARLRAESSLAAGL